MYIYIFELLWYENRMCWCLMVLGCGVERIAFDISKAWVKLVVKLVVLAYYVTTSLTAGVERFTCDRRIVWCPICSVRIYGLWCAGGSYVRGFAEGSYVNVYTEHQNTFWSVCLLPTECAYTVCISHRHTQIQTQTQTHTRRHTQTHADTGTHTCTHTHALLKLYIDVYYWKCIIDMYYGLSTAYAAYY